VIEPLRKGQPYPGRRPPVPEQWRELPVGARLAVTAVPSAIVALVLALNLAAGVAAAVLALGAAAATITYVKNRTDRHNAAIDRGELRVPDDPHLMRVDPSTLDHALLDRLTELGYTAGDLGQVKRFDGGWIAKRRDLRDIAVVVGDDGGRAYFDPRWVPDVLAATEYLAGRGREPV
jgi:hypothetical protein